MTTKLQETKLFKELINAENIEKIYEGIIDDLLTIMEQRQEEIKTQKKEGRPEEDSEIKFEIDYQINTQKNLMLTSPENPSLYINFNSNNIKKDIPIIKKIQDYAFNDDLKWLNDLESNEFSENEKQIQQGIKQLIQGALSWIENYNGEKKTIFKDALIKSSLNKKDGSKKYTISPMKILQADIFPRSEGSNIETSTLIPIADEEAIKKYDDELKEQGLPFPHNEFQFISASTIQKYAEKALQERSSISEVVEKNKGKDEELKFVKTIQEIIASDNIELKLWVDFTFKY